MATSTALKSKDIDLLNGPILGKVFAFVLPLMMTNVLQNLYNAADMVVVGLSNVEGAIGSIGTTSALVNMILNIFAGFAVGSSVMVARAIGEGSQKKTTEAVHTAMMVAVISGVACMTVGLFICKPILKAMGDEGHILDLATLYTRVYFLGVPFLALTNFLISIFRAKGDTRTPLFVLTATGLMNVALNLFFVLACGMSVEGVALATTIANFTSMLVLAYILHKDTGLCHFEIRKMCIEKYALKGIFYNGLPAGIQGALFALSNIIIQSSIISINNAVCPGGSDIIDGNAAGQSVESFAYVATNSVSQAAVTFTSQHYGARKFKRIGKVMRDCYFATFLIATVISLTIVALRKQLVGIYVSNPAAIEAGCLRILILLTVYFPLAFMEVGSGILRGLNKSILSTTISLIGSCVLRIVWIATVVYAIPKLEVIYLSYPLSWAVTAATHFTVSVIIRKRLMRAYPED